MQKKQLVSFYINLVLILIQIILNESKKEKNVLENSLERLERVRRDSKDEIKTRPENIYHLKWVHDDKSFLIPILPILLQKSISDTNYLDYKWYKHSDRAFIDQITNHQSHYVNSESLTQTQLYILDYNTTTHEELSSYEPKVIAFRNPELDLSTLDDTLDSSEENFEDELNHQREIFTLAYFDSLSIFVNNKDDGVEAICGIKILLPKNVEQEIDDVNIQLIQSNIELSFAEKENLNPDRMLKSNQAENHLLDLRVRKKRNLKSKKKRDDEYPKGENLDDYYQTTVIELKIGPYIIFNKDATDLSKEISCKVKLREEDENKKDDLITIYENSTSKTIYNTLLKDDKMVTSATDKSINISNNILINFTTLKISFFIFLIIYFKK